MFLSLKTREAGNQQDAPTSDSNPTTKLRPFVSWKHQKTPRSFANAPLILTGSTLAFSQSKTKPSLTATVLKNLLDGGGRRHSTMRLMLLLIVFCQPYSRVKSSSLYCLERSKCPSFWCKMKTRALSPRTFFELGDVHLFVLCWLPLLISPLCPDHPAQGSLEKAALLYEFGRLRPHLSEAPRVLSG